MTQAHAARPTPPRRLALLLLLAPALHAGGDDAAEDEGWLDLDAKIARASFAGGAEGPREPSVWGTSLLVRATYAWSEDDIATGGGGDVSGFALHDVDLAFEAGLGDFAVRFATDLADGTAVIEDAYLTWSTTSRLELQLGAFKPRVLFSNAVDPDALLFAERTVLGALFDRWDVGFQATYRFDEVDLYASVTNGDDGAAADHRWVARGEWALYDHGWVLREGSSGAPDYLRLLLGGVFLHDDAAGPSDASAYGFDLTLTLGPSSLAAEWMDLDDGAGGTADTFELVTLDVDGGSQPFSATVSHFLTDELEAAFRYQHLDDAASTELFGGSLGWHPEGTAVAWLADVTAYDREGPDGLVVQVGLRAGASRP